MFNLFVVDPTLPRTSQSSSSVWQVFWLLRSKPAFSLQSSNGMEWALTILNYSGRGRAGFSPASL